MLNFKFPAAGIFDLRITGVMLTQLPLFINIHDVPLTAVICSAVELFLDANGCFVDDQLLLFLVKDISFSSECATASANVTLATSRPTRTLAKKANCWSLIWDFFRFCHRFKWTPYWQQEGYVCWDWWILNDIEIALRNAQCAFPVSR